MLAVDHGGRCRFANAAAAALADDPERPLAGDKAEMRLPLLAEPEATDLVAGARDGRAGTVEVRLPRSGRSFVIRAVPAGDLVLLYLEDTTELRAARAAELQAAEQARLAGLAGVTGSYETDLVAGTTWLSEQARRIFGLEPTADSVYPRDEVLAVIDPEDVAHQAAAVASAVANPGAIHDVVYRTRRPDGARRALHVVGEVLRDAEGRPRTIIGSVSDVTDRAAAQEALRISEDRLRQVVEGVDAIISYRDDALAAVVHSPQIERILGYRPEEVADNEAWDRIVHPDDVARCEQAWRSADPDWTLTYRIRRADGRYVWVDDRGRWIEREDGRGPGLIGVITDITERKRTEEALRASEERLRRVVEGVDAIITYEEGGRAAIQSPQVERILGYPPSALETEESWIALVHPEDRERCVAAWRDEAPTWLLTYRMRRADGTWIWVDDRGHRFYHDDGRPPGYVGVALDASDRVEAEQARRIADERRQRVFDADIVGTLVAEADGRVLEANDYWLRLVGRTREELDRGELDWRAITTPDSLPDDDDALAQCRSTGSSRPYEKRYLRPDGTTVAALMVQALMPGPEGQFAAFALDLTERNAAAAEVAQLIAAIEQTSESVVITDLNAVIGYVNPAFERASGFSREEAVGQNPRMLQSGAQGREFYAEMWATLTRGDTWRGELVNRRKDGTLYTEVAAISPIRDPGGRVAAYVGVKRDVTAERELQARLAQAERMEAIGRLAGGIAHDFNNLLAVIRGYADLARVAMPGASPAIEDLDQVVLAADRASALTRQLLLFSRRQASEPVVLDVGAVVEGLGPMLRRLLGEHIELELPAAVPSAGSVRADASQLEQVVINLAANARDAMPEGGRLSIRTEPLDEDGDGWVRLSVADTGVGMDEAVVAHVFEPFFTTKSPGRGTGLGLSTAYGIVVQSGGRVSVSSAPGQGTTFNVDLPRVDVPPATAGDVA